MPHELTELKINTVVKPAGDVVEQLTADVCVVGAGISGLSAAVEARRLGRCVNSLIGLFCGVYGNGPRYHQLTHGIFDPMFADLGATGDIHYNRGHTMTVSYDEVALGRWVENMVDALGIQVVLGGSVLTVYASDGRVHEVTFATRHGRVRVAIRRRQHAVRQTLEQLLHGITPP